GDGLTALRALFVPCSPVDQDRLAQAVAPAGWCSRQELAGSVSEADVVANTDFCAARLDRRFFRYVEVDDGYQRAAGAWDTNDKFPHGHAWLTDQIHAKGFKAGLWLAPFAVAERSGVPAEHPEWLLRDASGPVVCDTRESWGGAIYALDGAHPKVQQWLFDLARRVVRAAGLRSFYQRSAWLDDPDCLVVRPPLSPAEAQAWASLVAVTGGLTFFSDNLPKLPPERLGLLQRTLPVAPVAGRPIDAAAVERDVEIGRAHV